MPEADPRKPFDAKRQACYAVVLDVLATADQLLDEATDAQGSRSVTDADNLRNGAYSTVLASTDAGVHVRLYDWFLEKGRTDQLLNVRPRRSHRSLTFADPHALPRAVPSHTAVRCRSC